MKEQLHHINTAHCFEESVLVLGECSSDVLFPFLSVSSCHFLFTRLLVSMFKKPTHSQVQQDLQTHDLRYSKLDRLTAMLHCLRII